MGTWDVRLISASYVMEDEEPVVELYGKSRDKQSVTVLVHGFRPYLFAVNPTEALERQLSEDQEVAAQLVQSLEMFGVECFFSERSISSGTLWPAEIETQLKQPVFRRRTAKLPKP